MLDPKVYLEKDPVLHADMLDALCDEKTKVIYSEEDGVLLRIEGDGPYAVSASTSEAMTKMAELIDEEHFGAVIRPFRFIPEFFAVKGKMGMMPCYQTVYINKEPLFENNVPGIEIKPLTMEQLRFVCDNYEDDEEYIKSRIEYGMLGAFDEEGNCAGFIGFHGEGSMGLLTVLPEYRRKIRTQADCGPRHRLDERQDVRARDAAGRERDNRPRCHRVGDKIRALPCEAL